MRITYMERRGAERIAIITDANGTIVRNDPDDGTAIVTFGGDRHDEEIRAYQAGGWVIVPA